MNEKLQNLLEEYMKERYKKIHNIKYEEGLKTGTATHIRVYRNGGQNLVGIHPFLMSNLEGILVFFHFFVNSRLLRGTVKILVEGCRPKGGKAPP